MFMKKVIDWCKKFKEYILITLSVIASIFYFFLKNRAYKVPDNSESEKEINKNSGKLEVITENIKELSEDESNIRDNIDHISSKDEGDDDDLDTFFKDRGF